MKLHIFAASPNCRKILALINHLDLDVELNILDAFNDDHKSPEIMALNPNGSLPILEDGDFCVWESNAIMQYLADSKSAESPVYPKDTKKRATITQWLNWQTAHYGKAVDGLVWENFAKPIFGMGETDPVEVKKALNNFHKYAPILDKQLSNQNYILGDQITLADFAMAHTAAFNGPANVPMDNYPAIAAWHDRLDTLDAWKNSAPPPFG